MKINTLELVVGLDKATDYVPLVSTGKNAVILLYQIFHESVQTQERAKPSWKCDLKIWVLAKNDAVIGVALIPVIGNIVCAAKDVICVGIAIYHEKTAHYCRIDNHMKEFNRSGVTFWSLKKHREEIASLLIKQEYISDKELLEEIGKETASSHLNPMLIVAAKEEWNADSLKAIAKKNDIELLKAALAKSPEAAGEVMNELFEESVNCQLYSEDDTDDQKAYQLALMGLSLDDYAQHIESDVVYKYLSAVLGKGYDLTDGTKQIVEKILEKRSLFKASVDKEALSKFLSTVLFSAKGTSPKAQLATAIHQAYSQAAV